MGYYWLNFTYRRIEELCRVQVVGVVSSSDEDAESARGQLHGAAGVKVARLAEAAAGVAPPKEKNIFWCRKGSREVCEVLRAGLMHSAVIVEAL